MPNPFEIVIDQMINLGFYKYLFPFIITAALFFAMLKKSKLMGDSTQLNAIISLSVAFLVFGFPVLAGISLETPFSAFFTQATVWILVLSLGFLMASFFYPDLLGFLKEAITTRSMLSAMIAIGVSLMVTSGLVTVFTGSLSASEKPGAPPSAPRDVILISSSIIIFVVLILIAASAYRIRGG